MILRLVRRFKADAISFNQITSFQEKFRNLKLTDQLIDRDFNKYLKEIDDLNPKDTFSNITDLKNGIIVPTLDILARKSKYLRPTIVMTSGRILDVDDDKVVNLTAALIECIHNITLIIDDIQDKSIKRRGEDCVHIKYGVDTALTSSISNAFYIIRRYMQLLELNDPKKELDIITKYITCIEALFVGVCWDVEWHKGINIDTLPNWGTFNYMVNLKTSRLLKLGVEILEVLYGKENIPVQPLYKVLDDFGLAFQINDDIVNLASSEYAKLKSIGDDMVERKLSFPVMSYLTSDQVTLDRKKQFLATFNKEDKSLEEINGLISVLKDTSVIEDGFKIVSSLSECAKDLLKKSYHDKNEGVKLMCQLFDYITQNVFLKQK